MTLPIIVIVVGACVIAICKAMAYRRGQLERPAFGFSWRSGNDKESGSG